MPFREQLARLGVNGRALKRRPSNIDAENFQITTADRAVDRLESRVYSVKRLIDSGFELPKLTELLMDETNGPWYSHGNEGGIINPLPRDRILVRQTQKVQFEIARLIRRLQELD